MAMLLLAICLKSFILCFHDGCVFGALGVGFYDGIPHFFGIFSKKNRRKKGANFHTPRRVQDLKRGFCDTQGSYLVGKEEKCKLNSNHGSDRIET